MKWKWYLHEEREVDREPFHLYLGTDGVWWWEWEEPASVGVIVTSVCRMPFPPTFPLGFFPSFFFIGELFLFSVFCLHCQYSSVCSGEVFDFAADIYLQGHLLVPVLDCHSLWAMSHEQHNRRDSTENCLSLWVKVKGRWRLALGIC